MKDRNKRKTVYEINPSLGYFTAGQMSLSPFFRICWGCCCHLVAAVAVAAAVVRSVAENQFASCVFREYTTATGNTTLWKSVTSRRDNSSVQSSWQSDIDPSSWRRSDSRRFFACHRVGWRSALDLGPPWILAHWDRCFECPVRKWWMSILDHTVYCLGTFINAILVNFTIVLRCP